MGWSDREAAGDNEIEGIRSPGVYIWDAASEETHNKLVLGKAV